MRGLLFIQPKEPNYSLSEITERLERKTDQRVSFILKNWNTLNGDQMAAHLKINRRTVFKLVMGKVGKKKHVVIKLGRRNNIRSVFDSETGIYYDSIIDVARANNKNKSTLADQLHGKIKHTRFKFI